MLIVNDIPLFVIRIVLLNILVFLLNNITIPVKCSGRFFIVIDKFLNRPERLSN